MSKSLRTTGQRPKGPVQLARIVVGAMGALALIGLAVAADAGASSQQPAVTTTHVHAPLIVASAKRGSLGAILVNSKGLTLYHYSLDKGTKIACGAGCDQAWPPLLLPKGLTRATAGTGLSQSLLGTVKRSGGLVQVTYRGLTLYTYVGDSKAGQTTGNSVPDWHDVPLKASVAKPVSSSTTTTGGYGY